MAHGWQSIQAEFTRRISEREWLAGELIPSESTLAAELGCSRVTVNRALRDLAEKGYLDRKRKAGTRVVQNPERKAIFVIPVTRLEIESRGASYSHRLLERKIKPAPAHICARMHLPVGSRLLYLRTLHLADEQPFALERRWVNQAVVPALEQQNLHQISANEWLVNNAPFTAGDLSFGARRADRALAELMLCEEGDALLEAERVTWAGDQAITVVCLVYRPEYRALTVL